MNSTKAKKEFKKRFGQANHLLITNLVGLDAIEKGDITEKPESFSVSWNPRSRESSAHRARIFTLKSFLGWAVESLEMYLTELNRKPKELESEIFSQIYSRAGQSIYKKATLIGDELNIDPILVAFMEVLITWRNYSFHYDIDNEIRPESLTVLMNNQSSISEDYCGLDISQLKRTWETGGDFTFKETASLISATHRYVNSVDEAVLNILDRVGYYSSHLETFFKDNEKASQKLKSLPEEKKNRYVKNLIENQLGDGDVNTDNLNRVVEHIKNCI